MINRIKRHLKDNSGDENTSKMTWVAIVFVIGAILLLLTTTAFKEPIQNWYETTVIEWFNGENGQYSYDQWSVYTKDCNTLCTQKTEVTKSCYSQKTYNTMVVQEIATCKNMMQMATGITLSGIT